MKLRIKYLLEKLIRILLKVFSVFPVVKNRVLFQSFSGRQYSDSPKVISEYLRANYPDDLQIIWAFVDPESHADLKKQGITTVRYKSLRYLFHALTCHVYVDNVEHWSLLHFRPQQTVINTWHGGGDYKQVGADRRDTGELEKQHVIAKMAEVDWFVSSSEAFSRDTIRGSFRYEGEIIECGLPRNDILVNGDQKAAETVRKELGLADCRIALYAPTFRNRLDGGAYDLDQSQLLKALSLRFGGRWKLLVRYHYYLKNRPLAAGGADVSDYPDMQQLLLAADVLITDYSSSIWDFSLLGKPCFLYAPDLKEYQKERTFYSDPADWPALLAQDNGQLRQIILDFDEKKYAEKIEKHHRDTGIRESGNATVTIGEMIAEECGAAEA